MTQVTLPRLSQNLLVQVSAKIRRSMFRLITLVGLLAVAKYCFFCDIGESKRSLLLSLPSDANYTILEEQAVAAGIPRDRAKKYIEEYSFNAGPKVQEFFPAKECGDAPEFEDFFHLPRKFRSRLNEDKVIYQLFFQGKKLEQGNYVELGAFDGQTESNSRFFDVCLGWNGLLIEGQPTTFQKLMQARPNAHRMSFAPACKEEGQMVEFARYPMANAGLKGKAKNYDNKPTLMVPCGPLQPVLKDLFGDEPIHFFSLDVEGSEPMVLKTIDFDRIQIDVVMVEVNNIFCPADAACESREETRSIMNQAGYRRYEGLVPASDVYIRPGSGYEIAAREFSDEVIK